MTVGELCKQAGISVEALAAYCVSDSLPQTRPNRNSSDARRASPESRPRTAPESRPRTTSPEPKKASEGRVAKAGQSDDDVVLAFLHRSRKPVSQRDIQGATGRSLTEIRAALKRLVAAGSAGAEGQTVRRRFWAMT